MRLFNRQVWLNFLALLPGTGLTILTIAVAFLRFYDEQDFSILELVARPKVWSNRLTVAALLVALVNFGVEWNRRNREQTARLKQSNAELKKSNEELKKSNEELKQENLRLAELESKIDGLFYKYGISSTRANEPEQR